LRYQINTYFSAHAVAIAQDRVALRRLATSGDYERVMIIDSRRYSRVVDPVSGCLAESFAGVSVVAGRCLVACAASTLGMLMGVDAD